MSTEADYLILGAGMCGLSAGSILREKAIILERESRPGGLVRTERFGEYWFDHVIHILYFPDHSIEQQVRFHVPDLTFCPPTAWVNTPAGRLKYPFQMHLGALSREVVVKCLRDLAETTFGRPGITPTNFQQMLEHTFGAGMCEMFLFPYNEKVWKRPLCGLAATGFQWTITHPDYDDVLRGALEPDWVYPAYNSNGWYPRPPAGAPARGMEIVASAFAQSAGNVRARHELTRIDLEQKKVTCRTPRGEVEYAWRRCLCSTLPLPTLIQLCVQTPDELLCDARSLKWNKVVSVMFSIRGPRPESCGHWEYFSDASICFTRLVFTHRFDPLMAPENGWGVMAELTERFEVTLESFDTITARCRSDLRLTGVLSSDSEIVDEHVVVVDPAYVVFDGTHERVVPRLMDFLDAHSVVTLGRYGEWGYSSLGQVIRAGSEWATRQLRSGGCAEGAG